MLTYAQTAELQLLLSCLVCTYSYCSSGARILLCGNGHSQCLSCVNRYTQQPRKCAICRAPMTTTRNLALESLAGFFKTILTETCGGCGRKIPLFQLFEHQAVCQLLTGVCVNKIMGCRVDGSRWKCRLSHHVCNGNMVNPRMIRSQTNTWSFTIPNIIPQDWEPGREPLNIDRWSLFLGASYKPVFTPILLCQEGIFEACGLNLYITRNPHLRLTTFMLRSNYEDVTNSKLSFKMTISAKVDNQLRPFSTAYLRPLSNGFTEAQLMESNQKIRLTDQEITLNAGRATPPTHFLNISVHFLNSTGNVLCQLASNGQNAPHL